MNADDRATAGRDLLEDWKALRRNIAELDIRVTHKATNAKAMSLDTEAFGRASTVPLAGKYFIKGAGIVRRLIYRVDDTGSPLTRPTPVVDAEGTPVVNTDGAFVDVLMPATRTFQLSAHNKPHADRFTSLAQRSARWLLTMPPCELNRLAGGFDQKDDWPLWMSAVFESVWDGNGDGVKAQRFIVITQNDRSITTVPWSASELRGLPSVFADLPIPESWKTDEGLPEAFIAELKEPVTASIELIKYLLAKTEPLPKKPVVTDSNDLKDRYKKAYDQYVRACRDLGNQKPTYKEAYDKLKELGATDLPYFKTWEKYVTRALSKLGISKNTPRGNRTASTTGSVVRANQI